MFGNSAKAKQDKHKITFSYLQISQQFTVPKGIYTVSIEAYGASGGDADSHTGGNGGYISTDISVTPGAILDIVVGGHGRNSGCYGSQCDYGYNGGGAGHGGGGGGATCVRYNNARLVVAGGGGGASNGGNGGNGGEVNSMASGTFTYGQDAYYSSGGGGGGGNYGGSPGYGGTSYTSGTLKSYSVGGNSDRDGRLVLSYIDPTMSPTPAPTTYNYYIMQGIIQTHVVPFHASSHIILLTILRHSDVCICRGHIAKH